MGEALSDLQPHEPYVGIDTSDEVLVAQSLAFEAVSVRNLGGQVPSQLIEELTERANRLASDSNLQLLINSTQQ